MPVKGVYLTADCYSVCLAHALTTEKEEVMGLLIGEISEHWICHISALIVLRRSDKRADRVEISPEQLSDASSYAEKLSHSLQRPMRIVGWYHSHPHITVWPSHIDVRTQASYQLMDEGFVGLIFSVFNHDKVSKNSRVQVCCFQSIKLGYSMEDYQQLEIPLYVKPVSGMSKPCLQSLVQIPDILCQEEDELYHNGKEACGSDIAAAIHNGSVYTKNMVHIFEGLVGPLMQRLEHRLGDNERYRRHLCEEKERLKEELEKLMLHSPVKSTAV